LIVKIKKFRENKVVWDESLFLLIIYLYCYEVTLFVCVWRCSCD